MNTAYKSKSRSKSKSKSKSKSRSKSRSKSNTSSNTKVYKHKTSTPKFKRITSRPKFNTSIKQKRFDNIRKSICYKQTPFSQCKDAILTPHYDNEGKYIDLPNCFNWKYTYGYDDKQYRCIKNNGFNSKKYPCKRKTRFRKRIRCDAARQDNKFLRKVHNIYKTNNLPDIPNELEFGRFAKYTRKR